MGLVERTDDGGTTILTLNRPDRRNALSGALVEALAEALEAAAGDPAVRVVVLTGAGAAFCAGGDLSDGLASADGPLASHERRGGYADLLRLLPALRVPVIAAVNGDALGGGCGLAVACDLAIVDPAARLGTPEIHLGLFPWIVLAVLQRHVGRKALLELALTGARITAERAVALGMANAVSQPGAALAEAKALASVLASRSPAVVSMGKRAFHHIADQPFDQALDYMNGQLTLNLLTEDAAEGVSAFLQKREPQWRGR